MFVHKTMQLNELLASENEWKVKEINHSLKDSSIKILTPST